MKIYEDVTSVPCPVCKASAGVWCGPAIDGFIWYSVTPWCHERRKKAHDSTNAAY